MGATSLASDIERNEMDMQSTAMPNDDEINEEHIQEEKDFAQTKAQKKRFNSRDGNRTAHLDALYDWLPDEIRHAPNIEWANIPSNVIGYLIQTVGTSPDAPYIAFAIGSCT